MNEVTYITKKLSKITPDRISSSYDSKVEPAIGVEKYIIRLHHFAHGSENSYIIAIILMERMLTIKRISLDLLNIHRIYALSLRIATKLVDDLHRDNRSYSSVSGLTLRELNFLEHCFLCDIKWNLHIEKQCFEDIQRKIFLNGTENANGK